MPRLQLHVASGARALRCDDRDIAADHHSCQRGGRFRARIAGAGYLTVSQHRRAVADALHFLETMADIKDGTPLRSQFLQRLEKAVRFLRRQHRSRFVENDELRVLQESPDDFDPLPFADGEIGDMCLRIERQAIDARQP
jgi:hypothetical protein